MALQVFVNSVDVTSLILQDGYNMEENMTDEVDLFTFSFSKYGAKTFLPIINQEVIVYDTGTKVFGGTIVEINMGNSIVDYRVYTCICKDFSHIMDRYLVIERFENKPVVTIQNDILNRYINRNYVTEIAAFEDSEIWSAGSPDTTNYRAGSQGLLVSSTNLVTTVSNRAVISNLQPSGFASTDFTDIDINVDDVTKLSSLILRIGDGATATNYYQYTIATGSLSSGFNRIRATKASATVVGSPSWSAITGLQLRVTATAGQTVNVTFDNWNVSTINAFTNNGSRNATQIVSYMAFNYLEPSKCIRKMAELFNWNWYVDADRDIHFFGIFDEAAPFSLDDGAMPVDGNYIYASLRLSDKSDQLRNGIYVRGGDYLSSPINDQLSNQVDGVNKIYLLAFRYAEYSLTVNGVRRAIGVENIDSFTNNASANQQVTGTTLTMGDIAARSFLGQQVLVTAHGRRSSIKIRVRKVGNPVDNIELGIFSLIGNLPTGPQLGNYTLISGATLTTSFVETTFTMVETGTNTLLFDPGQAYSIVVGRTGAVDPANYYQIDAAPQGEYDGKGSVFASPGGWSLFSAAMYFKEYLDFEVLYNFQEKHITFNVAPVAASTVVWTGQPYRPVLVYNKDNSSISTYGEFQFRVYDPSIKSITGAVQRANQELLSWAETIVEGEFSTLRPGIHAGMTVTFQSALRSLPPEDYLVKRVSAGLHTSGACIYNVSMVSKKTLNILYYLQRQLIDNSNQNVIQEDEILEKIENILESVSVSDSMSTAQSAVDVWSNDAGTTPNRNIWSGGADKQWQS